METATIINQFRQYISKKNYRNTLAEFNQEAPNSAPNNEDISNAFTSDSTTPHITTPYYFFQTFSTVYGYAMGSLESHRVCT